MDAVAPSTPYEEESISEEYRFGMSGTEWRLFVSAVYLFAENDYSSISMRRISGDVGIKAASIYNHFPSKEALLEKMYAFLEHYSNLYRLDYGQLLMRAETEPPRELLMGMHFYYPAPLQPLMAKLILIASRQMRTDERADAVLRGLLIDSTKKYITGMLEKMLELGRIEPLDVAAFSELYINNYYGAAMRMYSSHPVDDGLWRRSFAMMFEIIQPTGK